MSVYRISGLSVCFSAVLIAVSIPGWASAQDGSHGVAGDPGTDGEAGQNGSQVIVNLAETNETSFASSSGGNGGSGGNGLDGEDPDKLAAGGSGGDGGNGGYLKVFGDGLFGTSRSFQLLAGNGGNGGRRGTSTGPSSSIDGHGGNGGSLEFNLAANKSIVVEAAAGNGGTGIGYGQTGGSGGNLTFGYLHANPSIENKSGFFQANVFAGKGGTGLEGADGGHGGSVKSDRLFGSNHIFGGDVTTSLLGGSGGNSFGGTAGRGGDAELYFGLDYDSALSSREHFHAYLFAGDGGSVTPWLSGAGEAGDGGNAKMDRSGTRHLGDADYVRFSVQLAGGNGGDSKTNGRGGHGGTALLTNASVHAKDSFVEYMAVLSGGHGGDSVGGRGGDGGSLELNPGANSVATSNQLESRIFAKGGNGGEGAIAGNGGNVVFDTSLNQARQSARAAENQRNLYYRELYGGNGGNGGVGGYAKIYESIRGDRPATLTAFAAAGQAQNSTAGFAEVRLSARDDNDFSTEATIVRAEARGRYTPGLSRAGTDASAIANATTESGPLARSTAIATGGRGSANSGTAFASSYASNYGSGASIAQSQALAKSVTPFVENADRYATASSSADSRMGAATSTATSTAFGHYSLSNSMAYARGNESTQATAIAKTQTTARRHQTQVSTTVSMGQSDDTSPLSSKSKAFFRRLQDVPAVQNAMATTEVWVASGSESLFNIDRSSLHQQYDLSDPTVDVFSSMLFEVANTRDFLQTSHIESQVSISQDIAPWEMDHDLSVFFYDVFTAGDNLENITLNLSVAGQQLVDQQFSDSQAAAAFLNDRSFDLGAVADLNGLLELDFYTSMDLSDRQSFRFRLGVVGADRSVSSARGFTAVPEPASNLLLGLLSLPLLWRRRR